MTVATTAGRPRRKAAEGLAIKTLGRAPISPRKLRV